MASSANRFLRFFGSSGDDPTVDAPVTAGSNHPSGPMSVIDRANERLIGEIADFFTSCRLAVTAHNLVVAHSAFTGDDPHLARAIGQQRLAGFPITQEWLDERVSQVDQESVIVTMITQFEDSLDRYATTARQARTSTASCNAALASHVDRASKMPEGANLTDVLGFAQTILEHTRKLETDIRASENETRSLRERLARAQRDAEVDHLTGLPNRRGFEAVFDRHYREAQAEIECLSVAFCDIDHFKLVNDNHGHETGDRVIKAVAEALDRLSNQNCHVARHGGEEFVLMFRGLTKAEARDKLDAVRETFSERCFVNRKTDEPIGRVTFSGGVADAFGYANPREALRAADEALYRAKEQGRNTILAAL